MQQLLIDLQEELSIEFDDSIITDKQSLLESMRADALSFSDIPMLKLMYLSEKYNVPMEEVKEWVQSAEEPIEDLDD